MTATELRNEGNSHVLASSAISDERTRVLKHGETFAVFDHFGGIRPGGLGEQGLYHEGTRYLSTLGIELEGNRLFYLGSTMRGDKGQLAIVLTNPDMIKNGMVQFPFGALYVSARSFIWRETYYLELLVKNHAPEDIETQLAIQFAADFADIFEIKGMKREARGVDLDPIVLEDCVKLSYRGLDEEIRCTQLSFNPPPARLTSSEAAIHLCLKSREEVQTYLTVSCDRRSTSVFVPDYAAARIEAQREIERYNAWSCHLATSNEQLNAWINRAESDIRMMTTELPTGPYPYAGLPWFNTPFGRDGIITAMECLWIRPNLARGVLQYLASTQATEVIPEQDAESGKILHETRCGEMARLGEMPFRQYYGSVDATPLFIVLAGAYYERTSDKEFLESLWPNIVAALNWIDQYSDRDNDGFVEYRRQMDVGLLHQGWKDADDAIFHADGSPAEGAIALCEVQGYVYAAKRAAAMVASAFGRDSLSAIIEQQAESLRERFESVFWCNEISAYALALDGEKRACRVQSSNSGQCLFTGIVDTRRVQQLETLLFSPTMFSGWGVRTVGSTAARFNPIGSTTTPEGPILYPVACSPQSWSAAAVFLIIQSCLGLEINGLDKQIVFTRPHLPASLGELRIHNLEIGETTVDLLLVRQDHDVQIDVLRRESDVQILVVK